MRSVAPSALVVVSGDAARAGALFIALVEGYGAQRSIGRARERFHLALSRVEQVAGRLREADTLLEQTQRGVERKLAGLELIDDLGEALHRHLEARGGGSLLGPVRRGSVALHGFSFSCASRAASTRQSRSPCASFTATGSPAATCSADRTTAPVRGSRQIA